MLAVLVLLLSFGSYVPTVVGFSPKPSTGASCRSTCFDRKKHNVEALHLAVKDDEPAALEFRWQPFLPFLGFVSSAAVFTPSVQPSLSDADLLSKILADPVHPEINALYYSIFNLFATMPLIVAAILLPQNSRNSRLPAWPFLLLTSGIGYAALGPYLTFRSSSVTQGRVRSDLGWFTRNVLESNAFGWAIFGGTVAASLVAPDPYGAYVRNPEEFVNGFLELWRSSKFVHFSVLDISILHVAITALIPGDYRLRRPESTAREGQMIALATFLFPYFGSSLYLALRPPLPEVSFD